MWLNDQRAEKVKITVCAVVCTCILFLKCRERQYLLLPHIWCQCLVLWQLVLNAGVNLGGRVRNEVLRKCGLCLLELLGRKIWTENKLGEERKQAAVCLITAAKLDEKYSD